MTDHATLGRERTRIRRHVDCSVDGCTRDTERRGMCNKHYLRLRRTGTTAIPCRVDGCTRDHQAQGYCNMHYKRWIRDGHPGTLCEPERTFQDHCNVDDCTEPHAARGYCDVHYARWNRNGDPLGVGPLPLAEVVKLRRLVGVPDGGPTPEMRASWLEAEARS